jgi:DNA-binding CsgD family transcriptional regulator
LLVDIIAGKRDNITLRKTGNETTFASFIGEAQPGEYLLRLKDASAPSEITILKKFFGLTDREAEVLSWIAKGKSSRDIATILTCSPRTVNKHLEQVYHKLQVENRTAAAMRAIHVLIEN